MAFVLSILELLRSRKGEGRAGREPCLLPFPIALASPLFFAFCSFAAPWGVARPFTPRAERRRKNDSGVSRRARLRHSKDASSASFSASDPCPRRRRERERSEAGRGKYPRSTLAGRGDLRECGRACLVTNLLTAWKAPPQPLALRGVPTRVRGSQDRCHPRLLGPTNAIERRRAARSGDTGHQTGRQDRFGRGRLVDRKGVFPKRLRRYRLGRGFRLQVWQRSS